MPCLVGGRGGRSRDCGGRDDVCGGCVPTLLQPIVINHAMLVFFSELPCLHRGFRKAIVFSCHRLVLRVGGAGRGRGKRNPRTFFPTFSHCLPESPSSPIFSHPNPHPAAFSLSASRVCVCVCVELGEVRGGNPNSLPPDTCVLYIH